MNRQIKRFRRASALAAFALVAAIGSAALAEEVKLYKEGEVPTAEELLEKLTGPKKPGVKTRAIVIGGSAPAAAPAAPAADAVAFPINFGYDSADVTPQATPYLDAIGKAMQMDPSMALVIEGHTDARGSDDYNLMLSNRRALSVRSWLIQRYSIDPGRLSAYGKGESDPYNKADPNAPENRRVQFRRAG